MHLCCFSLSKNSRNLCSKLRWYQGSQQHTINNSPQRESESEAELRFVATVTTSCVNFPGKQRDFSHNLPRTTRFTHTKCDFALKLLKLYTLS